MKHETNFETSRVGQAEPLGSGGVDVRSLLQRYPDLSKAEIDDLVAGYRQLTPVQHALLASDQTLNSSLSQFKDDQGKRIRTPFKQYATLFGLAVFSLMLCVWLFVRA